MYNVHNTNNKNRTKKSALVQLLINTRKISIFPIVQWFVMANFWKLQVLCKCGIAHKYAI